MNDFLRNIISERKLAVRRAGKEMPLSALRNSVDKNRKIISLAARLKAPPSGRVNIIAEMKRASPSEGELLPDLDPARLALEYEKAGAAAVSILTEPAHFLGRDEDIREARKAINIPILRKDFTVDPWQVFQSAALGADVILLIAAALERGLLRELYAAAGEARLEAIIEVHDLPELETALQFPDAIIGVNNRNLATLKTDLETARRLAAAIPPGRKAIVESGIKTRREVEMFTELGYRGFLVGTSLLKSKSPEKHLAELIGGK
ncbi:MAG: indole-3-glycerol phosphate synthase TrpC [Kiritimatiellia bacterium]